MKENFCMAKTKQANKNTINKGKRANDKLLQKRDSERENLKKPTTKKNVFM